MRKGPPRFDPGMPIAPLRNSATLQVATGNVYAFAIALLVTYWSSGCKPLPRNVVALSALLRRPNNHVSPHLSAILVTLDELCPVLSAIYADMLAVRKVKADRMRAAIEAGARKRASRFLAQSPPSPIPPPQRATPYRDMAADMPALRQLPALMEHSPLLRPNRGNSGT